MIVNIIENLMITVIIVDMEVKWIVKVMKGGGEYMTEKRFEEQNLENHLNKLYDTKKGRVVFDEDIVDLLNELAEKNNELQFQCNLLREQANEFHRGARENANRVGQLEKENKELKLNNEKLIEIVQGYQK